MYLNGGGCSGLLHLMVKFRILALAFTLTGVVAHLQAGAPGQMMGTESVMQSLQNEVLKTHPWLTTQVDSLRKDFDNFNVHPTEDQVRYVLSILEPCTDESVEDVLSDPELAREAAWLLYLDSYAREGPRAANQLFRQSDSPPRR